MSDKVIRLQCGEYWVELQVSARDLQVDTEVFVERYMVPAAHALLNMLDPGRHQRLIDAVMADLPVSGRA